jgi:4'-phosphopantetheinyl transferase
MNLPDAEIHLWFTLVGDARQAQVFDRYQSLLTPPEAAQAARFIFDKHRERYWTTRTLVRTVLSAYSPQRAAQDWRFATNAYGCPYVLDLPTAIAQLRFNISHTDEVVVLGVRKWGAIGIDIEARDRVVHAGVADHFFSTSEVTQLAALPTALQHERFMALWTLKESYIKAKTMGLSIPLSQFGFDLTQPRSIGVQFDRVLNDAPQHWHFWQGPLDERHVLAVCAHRHDTQPPTNVVLRRVVPLVSAPVIQPWVIERQSF